MPSVVYETYKKCYSDFFSTKNSNYYIFSLLRLTTGISPVTHLKPHKISPTLTFLMVPPHPRENKEQKKTWPKSSVYIIFIIILKADLGSERRRRAGDYARPPNLWSNFCAKATARVFIMIRPVDRESKCRGEASFPYPPHVSAALVLS